MYSVSIISSDLNVIPNLYNLLIFCVIISILNVVCNTRSVIMKIVLVSLLCTNYFPPYPDFLSLCCFSILWVGKLIEIRTGNVCFRSNICILSEYEHSNIKCVKLVTINYFQEQVFVTHINIHYLHTHTYCYVVV